MVFWTLSFTGPGKSVLDDFLILFFCISGTNGSLFAGTTLE